jgi:anti-anti-sigma factor
MKRILVIDDEKPTLSMFRLFLAAYGFDVLTAENGEDGLEIFERERPPIVLTDIKMPGMDGLEVLEQIKRLDPRAEVIIITGHGDMEIAIQALNLNATDFINKPIQKDALDAALRRAGERLSMSDSRRRNISSEQRGDAVVIDIKGNVTDDSEPYLTREFENALSMEPRRIVLSFDENSSVNGVGLAVLNKLLEQSEDQDREVAISGLSENFRRVFEMVGITRFAEMFDTAEEALQSTLD